MASSLSTSPHPTKDSPPSRTRRLLSRLSLRRPLSAASLQSLVEEEDQELREQRPESLHHLQESHQPSNTAAAPLSPSSSSVSPFFISSAASAPAVVTRRRATTIARAATEPALEPSNLPELSLPLHPAPSPSSSPSPAPTPSPLSNNSASASSAAITMLKTRHSSELASRRRSTALSSLRGTREGQPAGKEALAGLLDFLASPSPTSSSDSLTPSTVAEPQPAPQALPAVHNTPQISVAGSGDSGERQAQKKEKREKREKKEKKEKNEGDKKSEGTPKKEKGSRSPGSAAKKGLKSPGEAERMLPDRLAMAAELEKETLEWEKELRTSTRCSASISADMAALKTKKDRRPSFTLRRRSSANLSSLVEQAPATGCTPQDAFFVEGSGSQAEARVCNTARARTLKMSKQEARMTWSPEMAAEMITQNNGSPIRFA